MRLGHPNSVRWFRFDMNELQKAAIDLNKNEFVNSLEMLAEDFFTHLKRNSVICYKEWELVKNSQPTSEARLELIIEILKHKTNSWNAIISYLERGSLAVADQLKRDAGESVLSPTPRMVAIDLKTFIDIVSHYYNNTYTKVKPRGQDFDCLNIQDVWVDISMKKTTKLSDACVSHIQLLEALNSFTNVAIIQGGPGAGKTTLLKRIAYDWAQQTIHNTKAKKETSFHKKFLPGRGPEVISELAQIVLSVPLGKLKCSEDPMLSIAAYFAEFLNIDAQNLATILSKLGRKLLLCLDGLESVSSSAEQFLEKLFKGHNGEAYFPHKLIVTTRHYAKDYDKYFPQLRFQILSFKQSRLRELIKLNCAQSSSMKTSQQVIDCLKSSGMGESSPQLVSFACHLAILHGSIDMTGLYDEFNKQMLVTNCAEKRTQTEKKKDPTWSKWRQSSVIALTAKLAFLGCMQRNYTFEANRFEADIFTCGFLQHISSSGELMAEFQNRAMQEYFAAIYCYQLMLGQLNADATSAIEHICLGAGQLGRFFFGICSKEGKFSEMLNWLSDCMITILSPMGFGLDYKIFLSGRWVDCTKADSEQIEDLVNGIFGGRCEIHDKLLDKPSFPGGYFALTSGDGNILYQSENVRDTQDPKGLADSGGSRDQNISNLFKDDPDITDKIALVSGMIPDNLEFPFDQIINLRWRFGFMLSGDYFQEILSQINRFPNLQNLYLTEVDGDVEVLIHVNYLSECAAKLNSFNLRFVATQFNTLKKINNEQMKSLGVESPSSFLSEIVARKSKIKNTLVFWGMISVKSSNVSLNELLVSLLQLSLSWYKKYT